MHTLIETCKVNGVNSEAWLAWVLERIQDHPVNSINELLPWNFQAMIDEQKNRLIRRCIDAYVWSAAASAQAGIRALRTHSMWALSKVLVGSISDWINQ